MILISVNPMTMLIDQYLIFIIISFLNVHYISATDYVDRVSATETSNFDLSGRTNDTIYSLCDKTKITIRSDGNLVLFNRSSRNDPWILNWQSETGPIDETKYGSSFAVQADGNCCIYRSDGSAMWCTWTYTGKFTGYDFVVNDGGWASLHDSSGTILWTTLEGKTSAYEDYSTSEDPEIPEWFIISTAVMGVCLFCMCCGMFLYGYGAKVWHKYKNRKTIFVYNPMVISVGIGFYDQEMDRKDKEYKGFAEDLDSGIRKDIDNSIGLFKHLFRYDVFPREYSKQDADNYRATWNKSDLIKFLEARALDLDQLSYDGLITLVSCHGVDEQHILTSDYGLISKTKIHRIFSKSAKSRDIPRMFIFDCCSGIKERETETRHRLTQGDTDTEEESCSTEADNENAKGVRRKRKNRTLAADKSKQNREQAKNLYEVNLDYGEIGHETPTLREEEKADHNRMNENDVKLESKEMEPNDIPPIVRRASTVQWASDESNPDYKLMLINAANPGFQSKLDTENGSYAMTKIMDKLRDNVLNGNNKFMYNITDETQKELHDVMKKQLIMFNYNNETRYVKFMINEGSSLYSKSRRNLDMQIELQWLKE